ncbi:hypothetical protein H8S21_21435 [Erwinia persicina]|uniref:conjugative transfer relaxase/helicase TraI domain-containing protein n=1 Tax=Erwinia persicina TaxID=55211 RepID=UPI0016547AE9|nr:conjugative transfer relaxase/helicase TraI domain-containing protein [Erwinia persicina]MBC3947893.1 hypothetical protein [Erwinia persicina]
MLHTVLNDAKDRAGGTLTGEVRMVVTEQAQGAVVQRSRNGETRVVATLQEALTVARENPKSGVVWQTGDEPPSAQMLKMSKGQVPQPDRAADIQALVRSVASELEQRDRLPDIAPPRDETRDLPDEALLRQVRAEIEAGPDIPVLREKTDLAEQLKTALSQVKIAGTDADNPAAGLPKSVIREMQDELQQTLRPPEKQPAPGVSPQALDAASRDLARRQEISLPPVGELGREMEHGEPNHDALRHIQKER